MRISDWSSDVCSSDLDRRGGIEPARRIGEALLEQVGGVDVGAVIIIIGFVRDVAQWHARAAALGGIAGAGERAERHPVKSVGEGDHHFAAGDRSEEHTSELQSLMRISYAVFCLKQKKKYYRLTNSTDKEIIGT